MPRIGAIGSLLFYVYADDHNPLHVHALYGEERALLTIDSAKVLRGSLPASELRRAVAWVEANRDLAAAAWARLNP